MQVIYPKEMDNLKEDKKKIEQKETIGPIDLKKAREVIRDLRKQLWNEKGIKK